MKKITDLLYTRLEVMYSFWAPLQKGDKKGRAMRTLKELKLCNMKGEQIKNI